MKGEKELSRLVNDVINAAFVRDENVLRTKLAELSQDILADVAFSLAKKVQRRMLDAQHSETYLRTLLKDVEDDYYRTSYNLSKVMEIVVQHRR